MAKITEQESLLLVLRKGDWFVFDSGSYDEGDLVYGRVMAIVPRIPARVDRVGEGRGGYRVRMHCSADVEQQTPNGVTDHYTFRFVDDEALPLTARQVECARAAAWPSERRFMSKLRALT